MYTEFQWHRCLIYNLVFQVVDPTYTVGTEETCLQIKHINLVGATERIHMSCLASYLDVRGVFTYRGAGCSTFDESARLLKGDRVMIKSKVVKPR